MARHLLHVGYAKAGSTALQQWFAAHPQIESRPDALAGVNRAHELPERVAARGGAPRWYVTSSEIFTAPPGRDPRDLPAPADVDDHRAAVARALRDVFGPCDVLVVTRGFAAIMASGYSEYVRGGGTLPPARVFPAGASSLAHLYDYDATLAVYREVFGAERVHVLPFELLRADAGAFFGRLEALLGVDPLPPPRRVNESLTPAELRLYPALSRLVGALSALPGGRGIWAWYTARIGRGRIGRAVRAAARLPGLRGAGAPAIPAGAVEACRGLAGSLAADPLWAPLAREYLNEGPGSAAPGRDRAGGRPPAP